MAIRMEKAISNAEKIVAYLKGHPLVKRINYPSRDGHPNSDVQISQATRGGSILSFDTGRYDISPWVPGLYEVFAPPSLNSAILLQSCMQVLLQHKLVTSQHA